MLDFRSLVQWERFITPEIIKPFYTMVIALVALMGLSGVFTGLATMAVSPFSGFIVLLYSLIVALLKRVADPSRGEERFARHVAAAIATGLFAVHPLRVEVVAWASCQPYLPSVGFAMLAVLAYLRVVDDRRPGRFVRRASDW